MIPRIFRLNLTRSSNSSGTTRNPSVGVSSSSSTSSEIELSNLGVSVSSSDLDRARSSVESFSGDDRRSAQGILKGCDCRWDKVRTHLLAEKRNTNIQEMYVMLGYRRRCVDAILEDVKAATGCHGEATGSTELTSDYDITFSAPPGCPSPGRVELAAVEMFHDRFRKFCVDELGMEPGQELPSGVVFDTNAYARGEHLSAVAAPIEDSSEQGRDVFAQNAYALAKARKFMSADEWSTFSRKLDLATMRTGARRPDIANAAERTYIDDFIAPIHAHLTGTRPTSPSVGSKPNAVEDAEKIKLVEDYAAQKPEAFSILTDRLYLDALRDAVPLRELRDVMRSPAYLEAKTPEARTELLRALPAWGEVSERVRTLDEASMTRELRGFDSASRMMANEAYFSRGALRHILPEFRGEGDPGLSNHDLFQSMNEQLGDALKKLHVSPPSSAGISSVEAERRRAEADVVSLAASAKYVERLVDAGQQLLKRLPAVPEHQALETELSTLSKMRLLKPIAKDSPQGGPRGVDVRTLSAHAKWKDASHVLGNFGITPNVTLMRNRLILLVSSLNAAYFEVPSSPEAPSTGARQLRRS